MGLRYTIFFVLLFLLPLVSFSQVARQDTIRKESVAEKPAKTFTVKGIITGETLEETLPGAHIYIGEEKQPVTTTNVEGEFILKDIKSGELIITASFVGSKPSTQKFLIKRDTAIGFIQLFPEILEEVVVIGTPPLITQRGDTTEFNAAAVKISEDAELEDLLKKLPGFEIVDGKLMANGEQVKKLYVDGAEYFLNDPMAALQNLPANIVSKIKMFDDRSEESKFSGYDDGNRFRSLNIETKNPNQLKIFGRASLSYNLSDDLDESFRKNSLGIRGNGSSFNKNQRFSLSASFTNRGQGTALPNAQYTGKGGDTQNKSVSFDFSTKIKSKMNLTGSYSLSNNDSYSASASTQEYFPTETFESRTDHSERHSWSDGSNHSVSVNYEYSINDKNRLTFAPRFSSSKNNSDNYNISNNTENQDTITITRVRSAQESNNFSIGGNLSWMHRFEKRGRTLTTQFNFNSGERKSEGRQIEKNKIRDKADNLIDTIRNLQNDNNSLNASFSASLTYSEPLSEFSRLSFNYNVNYNRDQSDRKSISYQDDQFTQVIGIDTALTQKLNNKRLTQRLGINYNWFKEKISFHGGASININRTKYIYSFLDGTDSIKNNNDINISPQFEIGYNPKKEIRISLSYSGNTSSPSSEQLQDILDVSNPLNVSKGNPNLKKTFSQNFHLSFSSSSFKEGQYHPLHLGLSFGNTWNKIAQSNQYITRDTIIDGYEILRGARLNIPVNLNGDWHFSANVGYSIEIKALKVRLNPNLSYSFTNSPSIYDNIKNTNRSHNGSFRWGLNSNISEKIDFNINSSTNYTYSTNTSSEGSRYFSQSADCDFRWSFWKDVIFSGNYSFNYSHNKRQQNSSQTTNMLNLGLGKKLFRKKQGEIRFSASDILRQRNTINYSVHDLYNQTSYSTNSREYYSVTFSFRFNSMNRGGGNRGNRGGNSDIPFPGGAMRMGMLAF